MQTLRVNGYDMAYLEIGSGRPLVCIHGTLGDFRTWSAVLGPLSERHRVVSVSLRHFFPERWDGHGDDYKMDQHVADSIAFIERLSPEPVDIMGHSRGGHIAFRVAQQRPELLHRMVLAEPGGDLDASLDPSGSAPPGTLGARTHASVAMIRAGDLDGALKNFFDGIEGDGAWDRLPAPARQQLRDNIQTLLGQIDERRRPYLRAEAEAIRVPTLFIGGSETKGSLPLVMRALAAHLPGARTAMIKRAGHWMFEQAPLDYCRIVLEFLGAHPAGT